MDKTRIQQLSQQYLDGTLLPEDWEVLKAWLSEERDHTEFESELHVALTKQSYEPADHAILERVLQKVFEQNQDPVSDHTSVHRIHFLKTAWFRYAAAVLIFFGVGVYLIMQYNTKNAAVVSAKPEPAQQDIAPGRNGAVLTLADGSTIVLDSIGDGVVARQSGGNPVLKNGQLAYETTEKKEEAVAWNTMSTPRGRQFRVTLPDGTAVWLNAASSIRFPTIFAGNERRVTITGEAYFEVAKVSSPKYRGGREGAIPFIVDVDGKQTVEVLGTHFNINSYDDEDAIRTTLLEGKVKVSTKYEVRSTDQKGSRLPTPDSRLLKPGEQGVLTANRQLQITNPDIDQVIAWKNGLFNFEGATVDMFMRQLARWYDLDIRYKGAVPDIVFHGDLGRDLQLSQVLKILSSFNIKFTRQDKTIIIE